MPDFQALFLREFLDFEGNTFGTLRVSLAEDVPVLAGIQFLNVRSAE